MHLKTENCKYYVFNAGVAELADAKDSKSFPAHPGCGFESHLRHWNAVNYGRFYLKYTGERVIMHRISIFAILLFWSISIAQTDFAELPRTPSAGDFNNHSALKVIKIIDGRTITVQNNSGKQIVYLRGIQTGLDRNQQEYSSQAYVYLTNLLMGEWIYLSDSITDVNDANITTAYVYRAPDGLFVNAEMIRQGYAKLVLNASDKYAGILAKFQGIAQSAQKGIWSLAKQAIPARTSNNTADNPNNIVAGQPEPNVANLDQIVYVTRTGKRYHKMNCEHISKSKTAISLKEARLKGYTPCHVCKPPQ